MTVDGQVWFPTFYDLDTVLGIDNSGYLTIEPDVEIESGSYNTSNSNLWSKVWNYFNAELKEEWAKMRQGSFTLDNLMNYIYGEQISKIPAKMYNDDAQVKYLDFGSLYTYCCHGSKEHQIRRWLRERIAYVDSMLGYFTSQEDQVTIRMNKTGQVSFEVTPYIPLYFSVKWSNATGGTQTFKLKRGETKTFNYSSTTSTDQEVIIYHAKYIKRLDNLSNLNPSSCILSNAVKLTNVEIHSSELYNINVTNNKFLRSINLENCTALGTVTATGSSLNLSNCKYLRYCNVYNTHLTEVQLNTSGGSLTEIYYPKSIQSINLVKQRLLELVGLPYGENGNEIPTSLYTISIQECPSITKLNTSSDTTIASSFAAMVYVNNLTIRNSLDLASLKFDGFHRLQNVTIENMYNLEEVGFNNLLPVGETSTIKYIGMSNCPKLGTIELNCTSNDYEITFADDAILNFGGLFKLNSITSNCVLKGIKTIVVPINLESMFFTNEYGSGYSTIENIWVSSQCNVDTQATTPIVTHVDSTYSGIDFLGMNLKNIDLGALVNIPKAINFKLSPTTVNPHFNLNRDGETYKYLQPVGTLDLSNYTESLAKFFDGVDLDKLEIICNNNLPQTDLSYCFYNSSFSTNEAINKLLTKVSSITNLDYCFYKTTIDSADILDEINMGTSSSMNYTFAECPNIKELNTVVIPSTVTSVEGMFNKCPLTVINNMVVNVRGSISGLFKGCNKLTTINTLRIPNVTDVSGTFEGCTSLSSLSGFELPSSCTNVSNLFKGCYMLTDLSMNFGSNITVGDNWYPPNLEALHDTTISNDYVKLTNCSTLKTINNLTLRISVTPTSFFNGCTALKTINYIDIGGTLTSVKALFKDMNLTSLNNVTFSSSSIIDYSECFRNVQCINNSTIINFPTFTDNNITMSSTFNSCKGLTSIVSLDYSKVYNMTAMYWSSGITSINDIQFDANICDLVFGQCINLSSINNVSFPNATSMRQIFYNTAITDTSLTIPDSCTNISEMFKGCTNLTDISGMTFGSGITNSTDCIKDCPITTANNITVKNNNTKFTGTTTLVSCTNFKITSDVTKLDNTFRNCTSLTSFSFSNESNFSNLTSLGETFRETSSLVTLNLSNVVCTSKLVNIAELCRGCGELTTLYLPSNLQDSSITKLDGLASVAKKLKTLYNLYLPDGFVEFGNYSLGWVGTTGLENAIDVVGFRVPNTTDPSTIFTKVYKMFKSFSNVIWPETTTSIAGMFKDLIHLTQDLEIPSHITNCTNAFKGCTSMTHVHSNWNNTYTNEITSTDCYAGCTGITHIDDENVIRNEYSEGLDEIPESWGGYGFSRAVTGIYEITTTTDNYTWSSTGHTSNNPHIFEEGTVNWGDGNITTGTAQHVYKTAGTYIIKGKIVGNYLDSNWGAPGHVVTKIFQLPNGVSYTSRNYNSNLTNLTYINLAGIKLGESASGILAEASKLTTIDGLDSVDTSECKNLSKFFFNCTSLTTLDLSGWNTSNITNMNQLFNKCTSLTSVNMSGWQFNNNCSISSMFNSTSNLKTIIGHENWNLSNTTDCALLFYNSGIEELNVTNWNLSGKGTSVNGVFQNSKLSNLIGSENLINSTWSSLPSIFNGCTSLTSIDVSNWDTSNVTSMTNLFQNCKNLQTIVGLENLDMSKVTVLTAMFNECASLTEINLPTTNFNGRNIVINIFAEGTSSLTELDLTPWTNVTATSINRILSGSAVTKFDFSTIDASVEHLGYSLPKQNVLQEFKYFKSLNFTNLANVNPLQNFTFVPQPNVTKESLVNFLTVLPDISSSGKSYAIPLGDTNKAKLTSSEIAIATNKGYTVA